MNLFDHVQRSLGVLEPLKRRATGPSSLKSEMFIWRVTYRDDTVDSEENGEGFWRVRADMVTRIDLVVPMLRGTQGNDVGIHHVVPAGCRVVFTRRRCIAVKIDGSGVAVHLPGWTIVGHERPDGSGEYYYYHNDGNESFASSDFNDPRAKG